KGTAATSLIVSRLTTWMAPPFWNQATSGGVGLNANSTAYANTPSGLTPTREREIRGEGPRAGNAPLLVGAIAACGNAACVRSITPSVPGLVCQLTTCSP